MCLYRASIWAMGTTSTDSRESAIRGLRDYAAELRAALDRLRSDLTAVERSISLLEGPTAEEAPSPEARVGPYAHLKPQAAVEKYLAEHPGEKVKPSELTKKLRRLGLPKTSKAFTAAITGALLRAYKKGLARRGKNFQGRSVYWFEPSRTERGDL